MALIKCPECKQEVSEKASTCPNCAYPLKEEDYKEFVKKMDSAKDISEVYRIFYLLSYENTKDEKYISYKDKTLDRLKAKDQQEMDEIMLNRDIETFQRVVSKVSQLSEIADIWNKLMSWTKKDNDYLSCLANKIVQFEPFDKYEVTPKNARSIIAGALLMVLDKKQLTISEVERLIIDYPVDWGDKDIERGSHWFRERDIIGYKKYSYKTVLSTIGFPDLVLSNMQENMLILVIKEDVYEQFEKRLKDEVSFLKALSKEDLTLWSLTFEDTETTIPAIDVIEASKEESESYGLTSRLVSKANQGDLLNNFARSLTAPTVKPKKPGITSGSGAVIGGLIGGAAGAIAGAAIGASNEADYERSLNNYYEAREYSSTPVKVRYERERVYPRVFFIKTLNYKIPFSIIPGKMYLEENEPEDTEMLLRKIQWKIYAERTNESVIPQVPQKIKSKQFYDMVLENKEFLGKKICENYLNSIDKKYKNAEKVIFENRTDNIVFGTTDKYVKCKIINESLSKLKNEKENLVELEWYKDTKKVLSDIDDAIMNLEKMKKDIEKQMERGPLYFFVKLVLIVFGLLFILFSCENII